ncbi:hypothetical protein EJ02DRAFT_459860 [Clathrospora elynae]|uniref:Uncharacterized protein n=1 Tax=Clathrospora elynae TaxID=706981 RepID=A0A6A5S819_9PLEO|nr:hypothetical protein EJ02DRAFT_459860 [Clathrospora elynae]
METPQSLSRKKSIFRHFSRRGQGDTSPAPLAEYPRPPRKLQRRRTGAPTDIPTPTALLEQRTAVAIDASKPRQPKIVAHVQRVHIIHPAHEHSKSSPPLPPSPPLRVLPKALTATPFSTKPLITSWDVFLPPSQVFTLYLGFLPQNMDDKWFIYSEGPDQAGKLKVHFHRGWTGMKFAELFVVMDTKGEGAGTIVGIKWNGGEEMNWMSEEEAKYMIRTACKWTLAVDLEDRK